MLILVVLSCVLAADPPWSAKPNLPLRILQDCEQDASATLTLARCSMLHNASIPWLAMA